MTPRRSIVFRWQRTMASDTMLPIRRFGAGPASMDLQDFAAKREAGFIFLEERGHAGVEIPAVVIESRRGGQRAHFGGRFLFDVKKAEDHIGDLNSGVIDIILHFDLCARMAQQAHKSIAKHGVAQVADVRGFIGIDVGVLDDDFARASGGRDRRLMRRRIRGREELRAVKIDIQVACARDFQTGDSCDRRIELAISCAICRGGRLSRLASSKQTGDDNSPMATFGGRSVASLDPGHTGSKLIRKTFSKTGFELVVHAAPLLGKSK